MVSLAQRKPRTDSFALVAFFAAGEKVRMRGSADAVLLIRRRAGMEACVARTGSGGETGPLTRPLPKIVARFYGEERAGRAGFRTRHYGQSSTAQAADGFLLPAALRLQGEGKISVPAYKSIGPDCVFGTPHPASLQNQKPILGRGEVGRVSEPATVASLA